MFFLYPRPNADEAVVRSNSRTLIEKGIRPFAVNDDEHHHFRRSIFNEFAVLRYTGMTFPREFGGRGASYRSYYAFIEELSRGSAAMAISVGVTNLVQGALNDFGTEAQKKSYLTRLLTGELLGAFSLSEPGSGSDAASLRCKAVPVVGGYRVTGNKVWCSNAGLADLYLLMARTSEDRSKGITAFLVPKDLPGFRIGKQERKLGLWSSSLAELVFEDCLIPNELRLGKEGEGLSVALSQLDAGRIGIAAVGLGLSIEAFFRLWRYRLELEKSFNPTSSLFEEGIQQRFAEHFANIQAVKTLLWTIADLRDEGEKVTLLASEVKLLASDLAMKVTSDAVEFTGTFGSLREFGLERLMRDAKALQIVEGTNQIQRMVISREITKAIGIEDLL